MVFETCSKPKNLANFLVRENSGESGRSTKSACAIASKTAPMNPRRILQILRREASGLVISPTW